MNRLTQGVRAWISAIIGCLAAVFAPSFFMGRKQRTSHWVYLYASLSFVVAASLYAIGWRIRGRNMMRKRRGWKGTVMGNILASALTSGIVIFHQHHDSLDAVIGYALVAASIFALMEISRPIFDFGMLQFFMRLPLQTAIAYWISHHYAKWYAPAVIAVMLFLGTLGHAYSQHCFILTLNTEGAAPKETEQLLAPVLPKEEYTHYDCVPRKID